MSSVPCPGCNGTGRVHPAKGAALGLLLTANSPDAVKGGTCHCDGPPHAWVAGWCPSTGPVTR